MKLEHIASLDKVRQPSPVQRVGIISGTRRPGGLTIATPAFLSYRLHTPFERTGALTKHFVAREYAERQSCTDATRS